MAKIREKSPNCLVGFVAEDSTEGYIRIYDPDDLASGQLTYQTVRYIDYKLTPLVGAVVWLKDWAPGKPPKIGFLLEVVPGKVRLHKKDHLEDPGKPDRSDEIDDSAILRSQLLMGHKLDLLNKAQPSAQFLTGDLEQAFLAAAHLVGIPAGTNAALRTPPGTVDYALCVGTQFIELGAKPFA